MSTVPETTAPHKPRRARAQNGAEPVKPDAIERQEPRALAVREQAGLPDRLRVADLTELAALRAQFSEFVGSQLKSGVHYGPIPGTDRPTLLKPGAEEVMRLYLCTATYDVDERFCDPDRGLYVYQVKCRAINAAGRSLAEGDGTCSSWESRYRWRKGDRLCPECGKPTIIKGRPEFGGGWLCFRKKGGCGAKFALDAKAIAEQAVGRVENPDLADVQNTILKMAAKRALVACALNLGCASERFTQDVEDGPAADDAPSAPPARPAKAEPPAPADPLAKVRAAAFARMSGMAPEAVKAFCQRVTGKTSRRDCTLADWQAVHAALDEQDRAERALRGARGPQEPLPDAAELDAEAWAAAHDEAQS